MDLAVTDLVAPPSVIDLEKQYLFQNYARYPLVLARGKGCYLYDTSGKRYLDLIAGIGVNALGHAHPRLMKVIREQAARMIHSSNLYYHEYRDRWRSESPRFPASTAFSFATRAP